MSSRLPPIAFQPRPSRQLASLLLCLQGGALTVLMLAPIPLGVRLPLLLGLLLQCLLSHHRLQGLSGARVRGKAREVFAGRRGSLRPRFF